MITLSYFLLISYVFIIAFIVGKLNFFKSKVISKKVIISLLLFKLFAGIFYIFINKYYVNGGDIFMYFKDANIIFEQLYSQPINYFKLVFYPNNIEKPLELKGPIYEMGFWQDTGSYMLVRFNALVRLISLNNIYINGVFAAFFSFIGSFLIAKVFEKHLKANKIVLYSIFISPSLLFWTSGIHKEFISVFALGLILYNFFKFFEKKKLAVHFFGFIIGVILFFFTRNYMLLALIPSLMSWVLYKTIKIKYKKAVYISLVLLIAFMSYQKIPSYNKTGFEVVIEKRKQFENLKQGNTSIELDKIKPNFISLMMNSPKALFNTIMRPHFGEVENIYLLLFSLESFFISILLLVSIFYFPKLSFAESNMIVFMLLYSFSLLLIIGWIVPNIGAIVRYRSIALILLIPSLIFIVSKNDFLKKFK